jgi:spore coat protein CotH
MSRKFASHLVTTVCVLVLTSATYRAHPLDDAAPAVSADQFFDDRSVGDMHITMSARDWATLKDNYLANTYYPCTFEWNGMIVGNSTLRSRGSGTRNPQKPGLRVDFNRYNAAQRFLGLKYIVLDNLWQDPSMLRERVTMLMLDKMGIPAPRERHMRLFINEQYAGLYAAVEAPDEVFVERTLGWNDGYLYEYNWEREFYFDYLGPDLGAYHIFDPKTRSKDPDILIWGPIEEMTRAANELPDAIFIQEMSAYMDLALFTKQIALENFLAESDGLLGDWGMNNFYMYRPAGSTRFQILQWDKDNTFHSAGQPVLKGINQNVLARRTLRDPQYMNLYLQTLLDAAAKAQSGAAARPTVADLGGRSARESGPEPRRAGDEMGWMEREIVREYRQIRDAARADPFKPVNNQEFEAAIRSLLEFASARPGFVRSGVERARAGG